MAHPTVPGKAEPHPQPPRLPGITCKGGDESEDLGAEPPSMDLGEISNRSWFRPVRSVHATSKARVAPFVAVRSLRSSRDDARVAPFLVASDRMSPSVFVFFFRFAP